MQKFVINLKRRPDRLTKFFERCPYHESEIEVIPAFDGKNFNMESKKEKKLISKFPFDRQPGAIGCSITHLRIWKKIVNDNIKISLVFEDDCYFDPNFKSFMDTLEIPPEIKILFPGGRFTRNFTVPPEAMIYTNDKIYKHNDKNWNNRLHERTTHCYIITIEMARFLIELFNISESPQPVDQFIIHSLKAINVPVHSTTPLICWSPMVGDSDIR